MSKNKATIKMNQCLSPLCFTTLLLIFTLTNNAQAFDSLNEAQNLIYDKAHLTQTTEGDEITYRYHGKNRNNDSIVDEAKLLIVKKNDEERRDVEVDFLSEERHMSLPIFESYRGNPILIVMLEHIAQQMGQDTGGGALYFRNRIRDALASEDVSIETKDTNVNEQTLSATVIQFKPFTKDVYLKSKPEYLDAQFRIVLSDKAPASIIAVNVESSPGLENSFSYQLQLN